MKIFSLRCFQKEEQLERGETEIEVERDREQERQNNSSRHFRQKKNKRISKDSRYYFGFIMKVLVPILLCLWISDFFFLDSDFIFFCISNYSKSLLFIQDLVVLQSPSSPRYYLV